MSGVSSTRPRINAARASIRPERRSPPSAFGRASPCRRSNPRQRIALDALTPKRCAACLHESPPAIAASTLGRAEEHHPHLFALARPRAQSGREHLAVPAPELALDLDEVELHRLAVGVGHGERRAGAARRADGAEQVGAFVALIGGLAWAR